MTNNPRINRALPLYAVYYRTADSYPSFVNTVVTLYKLHVGVRGEEPLVYDIAPDKLARILESPPSFYLSSYEWIYETMPTREDISFLSFVWTTVPHLLGTRFHQLDNVDLVPLVGTSARVRFCELYGDTCPLKILDIFKPYEPIDDMCDRFGGRLGNGCSNAFPMCVSDDVDDQSKEEGIVKLLTTSLL